MSVRGKQKYNSYCLMGTSNGSFFSYATWSPICVLRVWFQKSKIRTSSWIGFKEAFLRDIAFIKRKPFFWWHHNLLLNSSMLSGKFLDSFLPGILLIGQSPENPADMVDVSNLCSKLLPYEFPCFFSLGVVRHSLRGPHIPTFCCSQLGWFIPILKGVELVVWSHQDGNR